MNRGQNFFGWNALALVLLSMKLLDHENIVSFENLYFGVEVIYTQLMVFIIVKTD